MFYQQNLCFIILNNIILSHHISDTFVTGMYPGNHTLYEIHTTANWLQALL